jgi:hypothetical protein
MGGRRALGIGHVRGDDRRDPGLQGLPATRGEDPVTAVDPFVADDRAVLLATLAISLLGVPPHSLRPGDDLKIGDLVLEISSRGPADPDGIGWLLGIEGRTGGTAARYVIEPLGRPGVEQGWVNADFVAVPDWVVRAIQRAAGHLPCDCTGQVPPVVERGWE